MSRETAEQARRVAAADNAAAARACVRQLEHEVLEARHAMTAALADAAALRAALASIQRSAEAATARVRDPFAQLVLGSLAVLARDARKPRTE